jgi:hypothetical protein
VSTCLAIPSIIPSFEEMEFHVAFSLLFSFLLFLGHSFALPTTDTILVRDASLAKHSTEATVYKVYEFPNVDTFVQKMAVRANGNVLVTLFTAPQVWEINPFTSTAQLIYTFPKVTGAFGISEVSPDVFILAVGNFSFSTFSTTPGTYSVWSINMAGLTPAVHKVTDIPAANMLNGVAVLPTQPHTVLVGDSGEGVIYHVDTSTGAYYIAIDNPAFKPNASAPLDVGVATIHVRNGYLYFVNVSHALAGVLGNFGSLRLTDIPHASLLSNPHLYKWLRYWACRSHRLDRLLNTRRFCSRREQQCLDDNRSGAKSCENNTWRRRDSRCWSRKFDGTSWAH